MSQLSVKRVTLVAVGVLLGVSLLDPIYPAEQWLQHSGTPLAFWFLAASARRAWLSSFAFYALVLFLVLHVIGARYVYSNVPFGERLTWFALQEGGSDRNHYDRLVHFAFGFLFVPAMVEGLRAWAGLRRGFSIALAIGGVLAVSALYEIFEWALTVVANPADATRYNGQQGDIWDMQKDMFLALVGGVLAAPWVGRSGGCSGDGEPGGASRE